MIIKHEDENKKIGLVSTNGQVTIAVMQHYYSDEWWKDSELHSSIHAKSQRELREIVKQIKENCKIKEVSVTDGYTCTIYVNDVVGAKFWVKDRFGHIEEIDEAREA